MASIYRRLIASPSMPELLPIDPRSAEELTSGALQDVDENMFSPTARNRTNLRERCNADFSRRQQVVGFGAQAQSGYCRSRHAGDNFQLPAQDRLGLLQSDQSTKECSIKTYTLYVSNMHHLKVTPIS
jgi:hypothetical protein